jgi:hypothetical protein
VLRSPLPSFFAIFTVSFCASLFVGQACTKYLPHGGDAPLFPLLGRHAFVPCEGCHGPGKPHEEPTACIDCHNADRPSPNHNPGENCNNCHTEDGWGVGVYDTGLGGHTGLTTPLHTGTPTPPDLHDTLPADQTCWDCHEAERAGGPPTTALLLDGHYADPALEQYTYWDCGPCHETDAWDNAAYDHPCRTPHGSRAHPTDPSLWVVACADCHTGGDTTVTDCVTCHAGIFPHYGINAATDVGPTGTECTAACHPTGD